MKQLAISRPEPVSQRWPQAARSTVAQLQGHGYGVVDSAGSASETLHDTERHLSPRQDLLLNRLRVLTSEISYTARGCRCGAHEVARELLVVLERYAELERLEDERTYGQALPRVADCLSEGRAIVAEGERVLACPEGGDECPI